MAPRTETVLMIAPFVFVAMNAVKSKADYAAHGPLALPKTVNFDNIGAFWNLVDFGHVLLNSVLISGCVAVFAVVLSVFNTFALGIGRIRGRIWVLIAFLVANLLPQEGLASGRIC
jgi:raffinose/stachyose/melibiose transport system permease protein